MSPQFVDFDADGKLDIVAGIFDGSPHLARGDGASWAKPEQILDKNGERIVMNQWWNFDTKKWDATNRCDGPGTGTTSGHLTSAVAFDIDGDGDLDLLLGDHSTGRIMVRSNEGSAEKPVFAAQNTLLTAGDRAIDVPGTVATLRLFDWNGDGRLDLLVGSMGDPYGKELGGGVFLFVNRGDGKAAVFAPAMTLIELSKKSASEGPTRPDSGLYLDAGDVDGDGDPDLVVGGYSHWTPVAPTLNDEQKARVVALHAELAKLQTELQALNAAAQKQVEGIADEDEMAKRYREAFASQQADRERISKARAPLDGELGQFEPPQQRKSYVWLYTNTSAVLR